MFPKIVYGGDYNPEQWDPEVWKEDVRLMQEAGVNLVTLGVFSWAKLEPAPGQYDFKWLDDVIELLYAHGVMVDLATPTASPPAWLIKLHPEILPITMGGTRLWHGSRRHYCPHSPAYREHASRIAKKLADHYGSHPALAMWHIDNEYTCHIGECFCDQSILAFREWLKERYGSLDQLNKCWGTAFWSQHYGDWEEITAPLATPAQINPTQKLDWQRFSSDSFLACFEDQKTILRAVTPDLPITTNFMSFHKGMDHWKWAGREDIVSLDSYPDTSDPEWMINAAMTCDLMRSLGNGRPWIMMEQASANVNWRPQNATKRPGVMRLGSYQAMARGANGLMFFQWRASKAGFEKFHSGMLPHVGTDSRTWREVKALGGELPHLDAIRDTKVLADVGILLDWENWWALEGDGKTSNEINMVPQLTTYYSALFKRHITVDFVHPNSDLSHYKLLIAPNLYMVNDLAAQNINQFVSNGGTLLMTYFSGIVDENNQIRLGGYPAPFREMLGMWVEEFAPYTRTQENSVQAGKAFTCSCSFWSDIIRLEGAEELATYGNDYYAGMPAITHHSFGKGSAYYVGTNLDKDGLDWILQQACSESGIIPESLDLPSPDVEYIRRSNGLQTFLFIINHSLKEMVVRPGLSGVNLLTGSRIDGQIHLGGVDVAVILLDQV